MVNYRRIRVPGGTYFFTVTLKDRRSALLIDHVDALRLALDAMLVHLPTCIEAMVVLPDHLHAIWTLPAGDDNYPRRWHFLKSRFTHLVRRRGYIFSPGRKGEFQLWQSRYWEHLIVDEIDFARHVDYIHFNPVKHGWARCPIDWRWSSIHRFVREGRLPPDWAGTSDLHIENMKSRPAATSSEKH